MKSSSWHYSEGAETTSPLSETQSAVAVKGTQRRVRQKGSCRLSGNSASTARYFEQALEVRGQFIGLM